MAAEESIFPSDDAGSGAGETLSDAELIAATRAGDASSFAVLYTRHVSAAQACARRLVRSRSEADDLVAEGFAKVLGALRKGKGPDLAFRPYLLTAVRNALYDRTRRDSRVEFTDEPPEPVNAVLLAADYEREDRAMVAQAYAALPERWQLVLWHTDVEGRQPAEIAPLLGISANSVAALAYRAREGLRQAYLHAHVNRGVADNCKGTTEKLSAYVRDGLSARDRRAVQEHLDQCTACTALLVELQEANRSLKIVLIPVLAGVSAAAYLGGMSGGGITHLVRRNPGPTAAGAVAAAAVLVFSAVALASPGGGEAAQALTAPPVGSGRPTTTTTTTTTTLPPTTAPPATAATTPTTAPFTPPTFDTAVPPVTVVPFNPNATTATTVRRTTTTTRAPTTTTRPPTTTAATTTTTQPGQVATTTTTTTTTTTVPGTEAPPAPPALQSTVSGLGPVYSGQSAYFSVKVANAASGNGGNARKVAVGPAEGVVVTFNVPTGATFLGASSPDWQCDVNGATVRCLLPRLDPGTETDAVFSVDVPANAALGSNFTISPTVMVNGGRIDAKPTTRPVEDGSTIADYNVVPGGDIVVAGNSTLTCSPTDVAGNPDCGPLAAKVPVGPTSGDIDLAGRQVVAAYLMWEGKDAAPSQTVSLAAPGRAPETVASASTRHNDGDDFYVATADVTATVRAAGSGRYTVDGVATVAEENSYGGWSLVVLVSDPNLPLRAFTLATPLATILGNSTSVSFGTLQALPTDRQVAVAVFAGEGDRGLSSTEKISIENTADPQSPAIDLWTPLHPAPVDGEQQNAFRSAVLGSSDIVPADTFGVDLDVYRVAVPGAITNLDISAHTGSDKVTVSAIALINDL